MTWQARSIQQVAGELPLPLLLCFFLLQTSNDSLDSCPRVLLLKYMSRGCSGCCADTPCRLHFLHAVSIKEGSVAAGTHDDA